MHGKCIPASKLAKRLPVLLFLVNLYIPSLCSEESGTGSEYSARGHSDASSDLESEVEPVEERKRKGSGKAKAAPKAELKQRKSKQGPKTPPVSLFFFAS